jgi:hypothetical protein
MDSAEVNRDSPIAPAGVRTDHAGRATHDGIRTKAASGYADMDYQAIFGRRDGSRDHAGVGL